MSIHCYSGLPGSGKSYSVVEQVLLPALKSGRHVVTNVPLNMDRIEQDFPTHSIEFFNLTTVENSFFDLSQHPHRCGAIFIIDECWKRFPQGMRADVLTSYAGSFFAEHRHYVGATGLTTEIVLVCQSITQIAPFIRELIDTTYITVKLSRISLNNKFRVDIYQGSQQLSRPYREQLIRSEFGSYKSSIFQYYKSHTQNMSTFTSGSEKTVGRSVSIFRSPIFYLGGPVLCIALYFFISSATSFFLRGDPNDQTPNISSAPSHSPLVISRSSLSQVATPISTPPLSNTWRITGIVWDSNNRGLAHLLNLDTGSHRILPLQGNCLKTRALNYDWTCIVDGELITYYSGSTRQSII